MSLFFQLRYGFDFHASAGNIINEGWMHHGWLVKPTSNSFGVSGAKSCWVRQFSLSRWFRQKSLPLHDGSQNSVWRCCQKDHVALKRIFSSCSCNVLTMLSGTSRKAVNRVFVLSFEKKPSHWSKKAQAAFSFLYFFFLSVSCSWLKKQKNAFCTISCRTHIPDSSVMFLLQINWQFQFQVKFFFYN